MKRNTINFWIDLLTFIVLFAEIWTGLLLHYVLPSGKGRGHSLELWGLNRHEYGTVHFYLATAMIALVAIHVWLHWSWICNSLTGLLKIKKLKSSRHLLYGIVSLLVIVLITFASLMIAQFQVVDIQTNTNVYSIDNEIESQEEQLITGQTTLLEVANIGNIPVEQLLEKLNLPNDVDCKEQLGRLKRRYGFEIEDVRNSIIRKPQK